MASVNPKVVEAATKKTEQAAAARLMESLTSQQPKPVDTTPKPFAFARRDLTNDPSQIRMHLAFDVPAGTPYERLLEPSCYKQVVGGLRAGDLIELRWSPGLEHWALLVVASTIPAGAIVRELVHKQFEAIEAADWSEQSDFMAEQVGLNSWRVKRKSDGQILPGEFPTVEAARSAIAKEFVPSHSGRGWARSS